MSDDVNHPKIWDRCTRRAAASRSLAEWVMAKAGAAGRGRVAKRLAQIV